MGKGKKKGKKKKRKEKKRKKMKKKRKKRKKMKEKRKGKTKGGRVSESERRKKKKKKGTVLPFVIFDEPAVETCGARDKVGPRDESYTWVPETVGFVAFQKVGFLLHWSFLA